LRDSQFGGDQSIAEQNGEVARAQLLQGGSQARSGWNERDRCRGESDVGVQAERRYEQRPDEQRPYNGPEFHLAHYKDIRTDAYGLLIRTSPSRRDTSSSTATAIAASASSGVRPVTLPFKRISGSAFCKVTR